MKLWKKIITGGLVLLGILIISSVVLLFRINIETKKMNPTETMEFIYGIYSIKDNYVNMYLIKSGDEFLAIDCGVDPHNISEEMDYLQIAPEKVTALFLTHSDTDHTGALQLFRNAKVYISKAEEQMINGNTVRAAFVMKNKKLTSYNTIKDGQEIEISGMKIKGVLTPGHTPGSMSYIINGKYLFSGDSLRLENQKVEGFNDFFNMDSRLGDKSIDKLSKLKGIECIFTAHYGNTGEFNYAFNVEKN